MMLFVPAALVLQRSPAGILQQVYQRYRALESLSVQIEHEDGSVQKLDWLSPTRFELKISKAAEKSMQAEWFCDGQRLVTRWPNRIDSKPFVSKSDVETAFERAAGPMLSWLIRSPAGELWVHPPKGMSVEYAWGEASSFHDQAVREVDVTVDKARPVRVFLSFDGKRLIGTDYGKSWLFYREEKDNRILMPTLGEFRG